MLDPQSGQPTAELRTQLKRRLDTDGLVAGSRAPVIPPGPAMRSECQATGNRGGNLVFGLRSFRTFDWAPPSEAPLATGVRRVSHAPREARTPKPARSYPKAGCKSALRSGGCPRQSAGRRFCTRQHRSRLSHDRFQVECCLERTRRAPRMCSMPLGREPINLPAGWLARVRYAPIATKFRSAPK